MSGVAYFRSLVIKKLKKDLAVAELGASFVGRVVLFLYSLAWSVLVRLGFLRELPIVVFIRAFGRTARVRLCDASDLTAFREVFVDGVYDIKLKEPPATIIDAGSNAGLSVVYFKLRYPDAVVWAFEPSPRTYRRLVRNCQQFGDSVVVSDEAIAGTNGQARLWTGDSLGASLVRERCGDDTVIVSTITLDTAIERLGGSRVGLLKFDIEGAETQVFEHTLLLERVDALTGELHLDLTGGTRDAFERLLTGFSCSFVPLGQPGRFAVQGIRP